MDSTDFRYPILQRVLSKMSKVDSLRKLRELFFGMFNYQIPKKTKKRSIVHDYFGKELCSKTWDDISFLEMILDGHLSK
jgi:hypothetical protein